MNIKQPLLFAVFMVFCYSMSAESFCSDTNHRTMQADTLVFSETTVQQLTAVCDTNKHIDATNSVRPHWKRKKITAAILAFPLPFGLLGLHRIYLGTKPYVPFVYIGTIGGCLFVLPFIDFITILSAKEEDFKRFEKNPGVFMWSH